ncbi:MAG: hypothetical protein H6659_02545 [Ardenticatenaceae bacterium]|nr:hypothetical protein [Ardenticatenaceae bacterium]
MTPHFDDTLDMALERQLHGEPTAVILQDYSEQAEGLTRLLPVTAVLTTLPPISEPDLAAQQADRAAFLAEANQLLPTAVSPGPLARLNDWIVAALPRFGHQNIRQKESNTMSSLILKAAVALTIILGAAGGTAVSAAASLPDSPVYPVKIALEDARLALANDPETAVALHTDLAAERLREMEQLALADHVPDDASLNRLQYHLETALDLAGQLPEQSMAGALLQIQEMVQTRTRTMAQVQAQAPEAPQGALTQARTMLQNAGEVVAAGLQDPQTLRWRHTTNRPDAAPPQPEMTPQPGGVVSPTVTISTTQPLTAPVRLGPCATGDCGTSQGAGPYGPGRHGPQPEEPGVGPGPGEPAATPGSGNGQGPTGSNNPSPGECQGCASGNQYGPQPDDAGNGSGMPGGSDSGMPIGGQSQNGAQYQNPNSGSNTSSGSGGNH